MGRNGHVVGFGLLLELSACGKSESRPATAGHGGSGQKLAHIDADMNGACDADEPVFTDSALEQTDTTLTFTPDSVQVHSASSGFCDGLNSWKSP